MVVTISYKHLMYILDVHQTKVCKKKILKSR